MTIQFPSPRLVASRLIVPSLLILVLLANVVLLVSGQGQQQEEEPKLDLESMSDTELELICLERGFELVRDHSQGEALTHEDFVDAARRCLAIEEDMNEILEQNPDLAEELVAEIDRMKEEKELLEVEQKEMLAQKEMLEQQLAEKNKQEVSSGGGTRMWGSALDGNVNVNTKQKQSTSTSDGVSHPPGNVGSTIESTDEKETEEEDPCATSNSTSAATQDESSKSTTDFSLKGFLQEVLTEFEKDVTRMTSLLFPVLKPIYSAGNKAWNYVKWMFRTARQHYQKYQPKQEPTKQKQDNYDPLQTK